ncbi:MAG: hypothetical protein ACFCUE_05890 [Candidatus Bathyarchaeia archaeon]
MNNTILKCPICKKVLADPNILREHRLKAHKSIYTIVEVPL